MPIRSRASVIEFVDYSYLSELVERTDNPLERLGLFETFHGSATSVDVERVSDGKDAILARERGGERNYAGQESTRIENLRIPFFPLDKSVRPSDSQDFKEYGEPMVKASTEKRVERATARIQRGHDHLRRSAMYAALRNTTYAPSGASQYLKAFDVLWGVEADMFPTNVSIDFSDPLVDPSLFVEANCRSHIIEHAKDMAAGYKIMALCGSGTFNSVVKHPTTQAAFENYASQMEILRNRIGGDIVGRVWEHQSVTYIEDISGEIAIDEMIVLPVGIEDMFQIHYAPADTIEHENQVAEEMYIFYTTNHRSAELQTETSFVCACTRPELICRMENNTLISGAVKAVAP